MVEYRWQKFLEQLNAEYKDLGKEDPPVEIYGYLNGEKYEIKDIYNEDDIICIDIARVVESS